MVRRSRGCDRVTDVTFCWLARIRDNGPVTRDVTEYIILSSSSISECHF